MGVPRLYGTAAMPVSSRCLPGFLPPSNVMRPVHLPDARYQELASQDAKLWAPSRCYVSRFRSRSWTGHFPLPLQLREQETVPGGLFPAAFRMVVQRRQPAMRRQQSGRHAERSLESQNRALPVSQTRQGYSQIEMSKGKEMLQADGNQGLLGGLFIPTLAQAHQCEPQVRLRTVAVNFERALEGTLRIFGALLSQVGFTDAQMQVRRPRISTLRLEQRGQRRIRVPFFELNDAHEQIHPGTRFGGVFLGRPTDRQHCARYCWKRTSSGHLWTSSSSNFCASG